MNNVKRAQDFLNSTQNNNGGWGYRVGTQSTTEATALAVIARPSDHARKMGTSWLLQTQQADGGWGMNADDDSANWLTAWATWALLFTATDETTQAAHRGVQWLLEIPVIRITESHTMKDVMGLLNIDPSVAGWPWQPGEASFVEPTALGLLVMVAAGRTSHPRVQEGVAYLRDRTCQGGGWNVGNPFMFKKALPPTPYSTALALLALQSTEANHDDPVVKEGLAALRDTLWGHVQASTLAWGIAACKAWQEDCQSLHAQLLQRQDENGGWENSPYATASALFALQPP